ncbi:hypothetical protein LCGC14_2140140, partial [marine sediment metagenome]
MYKNKRRLLKIRTLIIVFIIVIIVPIIIYLQARNLNLGANVDINSYLRRLERNTVQMTIIGIIIIRKYVWVNRMNQT